MRNEWGPPKRGWPDFDNDGKVVREPEKEEDEREEDEDGEEDGTD